MCMSRISLSGIYDARVNDGSGSSVSIVSLWESKSTATSGHRRATHELLWRMLFWIDGIISKLLVKKDR